MTRVPGIAALVILAMAYTGVGAEEVDTRREDQLKAAYLFNFIKFVEWPTGAPERTLTVCFAGGEGVHNAFSTGIENKKAGQRALAVRRLQPKENPGGCNVVYLDAQLVSTDAYSLPADASAPMLTVSDASQFARHGGMIELFTDSNRLRFNVNVDTVQKAGLRISSSLLQLAAAVEKGGGK